MPASQSFGSRTNRGLAQTPAATRHVVLPSPPVRRSTLFTSLFAISIGALAGCEKPAETEVAEPKTTETAGRKLAGVFPSDFKCDSIATDAQLGELLGGTAAFVPSPSSTPRGVPKPCAYQITSATAQDYWTFDFDCRDNYKQSADALFAQYTRTSDELVAAYNAEADAGIKPTDAGVAIRPPEAAAMVEVGAKALDHHGRGLIFIDDDAPCYVRVVGIDAAKRLELAKLVAKNLTFANAPMTPRPHP